MLLIQRTHTEHLTDLMPANIRLKKGEDLRVRQGHPWIFSNEIDTKKTPLKNFSAGDEAIVLAADGRVLGKCYINPSSLIAGRLFSADANQTLDFNFFLQQITQAAMLRQSFFEQPYYRLIFSEADLLPGLIIDRYGQDFVVQINTAGMEKKKNDILQALKSVFKNLNSILLRNDSSSRLYEGLPLYVEPLYGSPPEAIRLTENEVHFKVPIWQGQKTGWFYDHRENRLRLKSYVKDKQVLDVFSYLGAWGLTAAHYGAKKVSFIESSAFASQLIQENATLNGFADCIDIITNDAFAALRNLAAERKSYDVIILDPPAFAKKRKDRDSGLVAYQRINESALKLLASGGILISCSCSMHISLSELILVLQRAQFRSRRSLQILEIGHQAKDHPRHIHLAENEYLKVVIARVR